MTVVVVSWILALLAVFGVHQTRDVLLETRAVERGVEEMRARACARSGVEFVRLVLANTPPTARALLLRPGAEDPFRGTWETGVGRFEIVPAAGDVAHGRLEDEGARLPVANVDATALTRIAGLEDDDARRILDASNFAAPAPMVPFDVLGLREPARVRAATSLSRFTTSVNVNTASEEVLCAVGVPRRAVDDFTAWRAGPDRREGTADDRWLTRVDAWLEPGHAARPNRDDAATISYLHALGRLTTTPEVFRVRVRGWIPDGEAICEIEAVLEARDGDLPRVVQLTEHWNG